MNRVVYGVLLLGIILLTKNCKSRNGGDGNEIKQKSKFYYYSLGLNEIIAEDSSFSSKLRPNLANRRPFITLNMRTYFSGHGA